MWAIRSASRTVQPYFNMYCRNYAQMSFTFASSGQVFYNSADVAQIDVPTQAGVFGILPNHVPVLAVLKPGVVLVKEQDGNAKKFFVSSGTVTVNEESSVQVLAEEACLIEDLDLQAAREGLHQATSEIGIAKDEQSKAEAQIKIDTLEAIIKAVEVGA